jgi:hypothetical protein
MLGARHVLHSQHVTLFDVTVPPDPGPANVPLFLGMCLFFHSGVEELSCVED